MDVRLKLHSRRNRNPRGLLPRTQDKREVLHSHFNGVYACFQLLPEDVCAQEVLPVHFWAISIRRGVVWNHEDFLVLYREDGPVGLGVRAGKDGKTGHFRYPYRHERSHEGAVLLASAKAKG